jgi:micrococcal nuclease
MIKLNYILFLLFLFGCNHPESNDYNRYKDVHTEGILNTESSSETSGYKIVGIKDGDTYVVLIDGKEQVIRLEHIDCPEKETTFWHKGKTICI